ncbi:MAG: glycosyltransferase family 2 protein [Planktomarina sp.]
MAKGAIILATYNGAEYIEDQICSILRQTHHDWHLHVSDDGSSDGTQRIINKYKRKCPNLITLHQGPRHGFAENFMSVLKKLPKDTAWVAFADQDDVWHKDKLKEAICALGHNQKPTLYCGRRHVVNKQLYSLGHDFPQTPQASFSNALAQNIAAGNTLVINNAALKIVQKADHSGVPYHDWWLYLLITGTGGSVIFDPKPSLLYRQHSRNIVGANIGFYGLWHRLKRLMNGKHAQDMAALTHALHRNQNLLTRDARRTLKEWSAHQTYTLLQRASKAFDLPAKRQTLLGQIAFCTADILGLLKPTHPKAHGKLL